ncbi:PREDICTED: lachesin-like [Priapulus caudatus]|uniref:Lachesin-like n=1 Tax=Priapulus caudatus TaxID=37621 RepID=A0ABM1E3N3_PRICU|nr:PREDICTED: lachesin-like [Priapulus caudatus]
MLLHSWIGVVIGVAVWTASTVSAQSSKNGTGIILPRIIYTSPDMTIVSGGKAILKCFMEHLGQNHVLWIHKANGQFRVLTSGGSRITSDTRFTVEVKSANQFNLNIREVYEEDAGEYQCQISASSVVSRSTHVTVHTPPVITQDSSRILQVGEGNKVYLVCNATGFPKPRVYWQRENEAILPMGGFQFWGNVLEINAISREDRGIYICYATNSVGSGDKRSIPVLVEFPPVVKVPRPEVYVARGQSAELECVVEGFPDPWVDWYNDRGELVRNVDEIYRTTNLVAGNEMKTSKLSISTVRDEHYRQYRCHTENEKGAADGYVKLSVTSGAMKTPLTAPLVLGLMTLVWLSL